VDTNLPTLIVTVPRTAKMLAGKTRIKPNQAYTVTGKAKKPAQHRIPDLPASASNYWIL
jgi:hypothetical protein